jgi:hypothetical protein
VTLDTLWGAAGQSLHERLREAGTPPAVFQVIEQELMARLKRPLLVITGWSRVWIPSTERAAMTMGSTALGVVANCSALKHGPGQSVKFLAAREHIDNQLYALDLCP